VLITSSSKAPDVKLTQHLERIWAEYPGGLLDISEEELRKLDPEALAVEVVKKEEHDEAIKDRNKILSSEDMEQLRSEMFLQLK
jgi:hypothetical protein